MPTTPTESPARIDTHQLAAELDASIARHADRVRLAPLPDYADELRVIETEFLDRTAGMTPTEHLETLLRFQAVIDGLVDEAQRNAEAVPS